MGNVEWGEGGGTYIRGGGRVMGNVEWEREGEHGRVEGEELKGGGGVMVNVECEREEEHTVEMEGG
jgi:hypothetical protein